MTECTLDTSPVDWVIDHPEIRAILKALGIDYTCAGKSLEFACRQQGLDPFAVLEMLLRSMETFRRTHDDCIATTA